MKKTIKLYEACGTGVQEVEVVIEVPEKNS